MSKANDAVIKQDWKRASGRRLPNGEVRWRRELRGQVTRAQVMGYVVQVDHLTYVGTTDGRPFSLAAAREAVRGVGNARIWRPTGQPMGHKAGR